VRATSHRLYAVVYIPLRGISVLDLTPGSPSLTCPIAEDDDPFGTAVQLAARMVDHARPGQGFQSDLRA
jgi:hypothetical protein